MTNIFYAPVVSPADRLGVVRPVVARISTGRRTIAAGCSTLLPVTMTGQRRTLTSSTSACLTIGYSGGQRRWSEHLLFTRRQSVDREASWMLMRSELVCCRQTTGSDSTSMNWRNSTKQRSRCYWIGSLQRGLSPAPTPVRPRPRASGGVPPCTSDRSWRRHTE